MAFVLDMKGSTGDHSFRAEIVNFGNVFSVLISEQRLDSDRKSDPENRKKYVNINIAHE